MKEASMRHDFIWVFGGNSIYMACQWGILVALSKLGGPDVVGLFGIALALTAPVIMFTNLELRSIQATDMQNEFYFEQYFVLRILTTTIAIIVIGIFALITSGLSNRFWIIFLMGIAKAIEALSDVIYGLFQKYQYMRKIAISMVLKGFFSLLIFVCSMRFSHDLRIGLISMSLTWLIILVLYDFPSTRVIIRELLKYPNIQNDNAEKIEPKLELLSLLKLVKISFPLGLMMMLVSLNVNIPRYFLQIIYGEKQLGFYVAVSYIVVALNAIVTALGQSGSPRLAKAYLVGGIGGQYGKLFMKMIAVIVGLGVLLTGVIMIFGRFVLVFIYRPEYASYNNVFLWLIIASSLGSIGIILRYGAISSRKFNVLLPLWSIITISNAMACYLLIPRYGMIGAAIATNVSAIIQIIGHILILKRPSRLTGWGVNEGSDESN